MPGRATSRGPRCLPGPPRLGPSGGAAPRARSAPAACRPARMRLRLRCRRARAGRPRSAPARSARRACGSCSNGAIPSAPTKPGTKKLVIPRAANRSTRAAPRRAGRRPAAGAAPFDDAPAHRPAAGRWAVPSGACSIRPSDGSGVAAVMFGERERARVGERRVAVGRSSTTIGRCRRDRVEHLLGHDRPRRDHELLVLKDE